MKHRILAFIVLSGLSLTAPGALARVRSGGGAVGEFKGYVAINDLLRTRLLDPVDQRTFRFELSAYFGERYPQAGGLASLLGTFSGQAGANSFRNGNPNGVNMLLWDIGFTALGKSLATACEDGGADRLPYKVNDAVLAEIRELCTAGDDEAARRAHLGGLWMSLLSFDLPEAEYRAYVDFFATDSAVLALPAKDQVAVALTALFMNPLVLLEN